LLDALYPLDHDPSPRTARRLEQERKQKEAEAQADAELEDLNRTGSISARAFSKFGGSMRRKTPKTESDADHAEEAEDTFESPSTTTSLFVERDSAPRRALTMPSKRQNPMKLKVCVLSAVVMVRRAWWR
jgi:hypothetical protein